MPESALPLPWCWCANTVGYIYVVHPLIVHLCVSLYVAPASAEERLFHRAHVQNRRRTRLRPCRIRPHVIV